jgi:hypothetical protein
MSGIVRASTLDVTIDGTPVDCLAADWSLSYEQSVGEASITLIIPPAGVGEYYSDVTITANGHLRFTGFLMQYDRVLYPRQGTIPVMGRLWRAQQFLLLEEFSNEEKGLHLFDLAGGPATDQAIVQAVLDYIGLDTNGGVIGGTGRVMGATGPEEFVWKKDESALDYIQRIDKVSAGYRTFETAGGAIYRTQISSRPSGTPDFTLTEGVDIASGTSTRTVRDAYNAVRVAGYDVGDYADPRVFYIEESNPFQGGSNPTRVFDHTDKMIERRAESSPGSGMSCEAMCNFFLGEYNREVVKVSLTTPRADVFGPGQIHLVQGPGGAPDRLGTGELLWVQRVAGHYDQSGAFNQSLEYIGGGA